MPVAAGGPEPELVLLGVPVLLGARAPAAWPPCARTRARRSRSSRRGSPPAGTAAGTPAARLLGAGRSGCRACSATGSAAGSHGRAVAVSSARYVGQLVLRPTPREVRVGLVEADLREPLHHAGARERLRQEQDVGMVALHLGEQPLPERERLRVRVVHAEDRDASLDPEQDHARGARATAPSWSFVSKSIG